MLLFKKIFFTISIVLLVFFALFINHLIQNEKEKTLNSLITKIENNKHFYAPILSQSLFTFDKTALETYLSAIYLDEEVVKIDFKDFSSTINIQYSSKMDNSNNLIESAIPLHIGEEQLGLLTISYTKNKILNTIDIFTSNILQISLLFLFLTISIIFYFIKNITQSINQLTIVSTQIASGNLDVPINIKSNDEIGLLAEKFEIMKKALIERIDLIDKQNYEIKNFNENLQKSNTFLIQSQSIANVGSWEIDKKKNQLICSKQLFKIFEVEEQEFDANYNNFLKFVHQNDRKKVEIIHNTSIQNKQNYTIEYNITGKSNILKTVRETCIHILNNDEIVKTIGTIQDITEMKEKDTLLYQQSRMAAMGEMLENIAHQWRQPLSVISVAATGLKLKSSFDMLDNDEIDTTMDNINNSVQHLSQTINDFRDFFKSSKKKNQFLINNVFKKTFNLVSSQFKTADIIIIKNIEEVSLFSLENELIQVLINILNNARDELIKTKNQDKLILIDAVKKEDYVEILIKDNAGGIPNDIINNIFESHFTTKEDSNGTGVGLYMSKTIIEEHIKGSISVSNVKFEHNGILYSGAQFKLLLPFQENIEEVQS